MAQILNGKEVSQLIIQKLAEESLAFKKPPCLAVILVGDDPASGVYVSGKEQACKKAGFRSVVIREKKSISSKKLLAIIYDLNKDRSINGILCQLPLPGHIEEQTVINAIDPLKDVDCFHPYNLGRLLAGSPVILPCTPAGIIGLLEHYNINLTGKNCAVIGRSNIVGKPLSLLLTMKNATVTLCHSRTENLKKIILGSDLIFAAIGKPEFIKGDMIKKGAVVIDVGINRVEAPSAPRGFRLLGDVEYEKAGRKASYITPVPGGVGPMTIAMLLKNTMDLFRLQKKNKNHK